jgi:desulfoferrodoxin (superoxide reductase-like protein)
MMFSFKGLTMGVLVIMLLSMCSIKDVGANVPTVTASGIFQGNSFVVTLKVNHQSPTQSHYVNWVEVDYNGNISRYIQSPQSQLSFEVKANLGSVTDLPTSVKVRANCILHGANSWVTMPIYVLTVLAPDGSGSTNPSPESYRYYLVVNVPVKATPAANWTFSHWLLDNINIGSVNPYNVKMNMSHQIKAVFIKTIKYTLSIQQQGSGTINPPQGNYTYNQPTTVPVTAAPATGWKLDHWLLDNENIGSTNPYTVNMNANHTLKAVFAEVSIVSYTLNILQQGSGSTSPILGNYTYNHLTTVPVTATPVNGWKLNYWLLDDENIGSTNPYTVNMNANHTLKAVFTEASMAAYTLSIQQQQGSGTTSPPQSNYTYNQPTTVPVTAAPATGWKLDHWLLDNTNIGSTNPYTVNMNSNHTLKAVFTQIPTTSYTLNILQQQGSGTTNPTPGKYTYNQPTTVPVTASPATGWKLDHWLLDNNDIGSTNPYTANMNANHTLKAVFAEVPTVSYTLSIQQQGSGTINPPQGNYTYNQPTTVPVTATPASGWKLDYWLVDSTKSSNVNPITITMNKSHILIAVFTKIGDSGSTGGIPGYPLESIMLGIVSLITLLSLKKHVYIKNN